MMAVSGHREEMHEVALQLLDQISMKNRALSVSLPDRIRHMRTLKPSWPMISEHYPSVDVDLYDGGQPLYFYILAVD